MSSRLDRSAQWMSSRTKTRPPGARSSSSRTASYMLPRLTASPVACARPGLRQQRRQDRGSRAKHVAGPSAHRLDEPAQPVHERRVRAGRRRPAGCRNRPSSWRRSSSASPAPRRAGSCRPPPPRPRGSGGARPGRRSRPRGPAGRRRAQRGGSWIDACSCIDASPQWSAVEGSCAIHPTGALTGAADQD